jgi:hypothetical protein
VLTRNWYDWSPRYPAIVQAVDALRVRSCLIAAEAVACDDQGLAVFDRLRHQRADGSVFLYAFDLLELDGQDLRREPLETRKATLASLLRSSQRSNESAWRSGSTTENDSIAYSAEALLFCPTVMACGDLATDISALFTGTHSNITATDQIRPIATMTAIPIHARMCHPLCVTLSWRIRCTLSVAANVWQFTLTGKVFHPL